MLTHREIEFLDMSHILIPEDRQRQVVNEKQIEDLATSIKEVGLIHPLTITNEGVLVTGLRRFRALKKIYEEEDAKEVTFGSKRVPFDSAPCIRKDNLSELELAQLEYAENYYRVDLTWQERNDALLRIHRARQAENPQQTPRETAEEISESIGHTRAPTTISREISQALILEEHKDDPQVQKAKKQEQALAHVHRKAEGLLRARQTELLGIVHPKHEIINGDAFEELKRLNENHFDLIIADPPYGYNADTFNRPFAHGYDDSPESAQKLWKLVFSEGFRLTKPRANLFMFCTIEHFVELAKMAAQWGWTPWPRPLIWKKSNEGLAPWKGAGFRYCWEPILWCTKGHRGLLHTHVDWFDEYKVTANRKHAAEKPVGLYSRLIRLTCAPGEYVLDPMCGAGTIFPAANEHQVIATGIELDPTSYGLATLRVNEGLESEEEGNTNKEGNTNADEV